MSYLAFLDIVEHATVVLTDSGGIQEETSALGVPCITLRSSTERPVTIRLGTNRLAGDDLADLIPALRGSLSGIGRPRRGFRYGTAKLRHG
jgi:UDP-N-acetylglucosamine 2-epimerase (non-hydrolysing)